jgi:hypothetical protein
LRLQKLVGEQDNKRAKSKSTKNSLEHTHKH